VNVSRTVFSLTIAICLVIVVITPVSATTIGGGSVQGYAADSPYEIGTIVQLTGKDANAVTIAKQSELQNMFGIVVDRNILPVTISNADLKNEAFVAASGTYNTLVSDQSGPIASGDYVTLSSINGVAMKAGTKEKTVFGRANAPFNSKGTTLGTSILKDVDGNTNKEVTLGSIPVTIDIKSNPNVESTEAQLPDFLKRVGQAIAEKEVSPVRIYLSLGITLISILAAIAILYSGVRNGVISIGRNPMSKKSIFRALMEVILTSILILIIGLFAVYLLLRL
jgi:hypothetical protein